jgi:hypothetical protein
MTDRRSHVHGETTCRIYERQCSRRVNLRMRIGIFIAMATFLDIKMCESRPARNHCLGDRHLSLFSQLDWKWCRNYCQLILHRVLRASTPFLVYRSRSGAAQNYRALSRNARPRVMHGQSTKTNTIYKAIEPHTIAIIIILFSVKFYTP